MVVDIKQLEKLYFENDIPVQYTLKNELSKGKIIKIYPIKVIDWSMFESCVDVISQDKQDYNDIDILSMSYLDFIYKVLIPNGVNKDGTSVNAIKLAKILELSLGEPDVNIGTYKNKNCLVLSEDKIITSKEFEDIRKIILFQNIEDYDDRYVSPDVKQLYAEYLKTTNSNSVDPSLERKKTFVIGKTGIMMNELNKMSYRIFHQIYLGAIETDMYYANKIIQSSQKYDVKEEVIYPLFTKKKDKYANIFVSKSSVENKLGKING